MNGDSRQAVAILREPRRAGWRRMQHLAGVLTTTRIAEIPALLEELEAAVGKQGYCAAGFMAYEAAPALDEALQTHDGAGFPLAWFGVFKASQPLTRLPASAEQQPGLGLAWQSEVTAAHHQAGIAAIRRYIQAGDIYQVNYTYRLHCRADTDPWALFVQRVGGQAPPYAAYIDTGEWVICSLSPELFLRLEGEQVWSRPMKGTAARGLWPAADRVEAAALRRSAKERAENAMIVDMVRNDLGRIATVGSVVVPALFELERYPTLWQMTSLVQAHTQARVPAILRAAFPAASITGAPKTRAMQIIRQLETSPRRIYTGTIGFMAPDHTAQFNVAIRTLLFHRPSGAWEYGVGGGIVWDSVPACEWQESLTKSRVITSSPTPFALLETLLWTPERGYFLWRYHLSRLAESAAYFALAFDQCDLQAKLQAMVSCFPQRPQRVRIQLDQDGRLTTDWRELGAEDMRFKPVTLAGAPIDRDDVFMYHKTTRRAVYTAARASRPAYEDVILFNTNAEVTESTLANLVITTADGRLVTPPIASGLLAGTYRAWLVAQGLVQTQVVSVEAMFASPRVYLMNSVKGLQRVTVDRL